MVRLLFDGKLDCVHIQGMVRLSGQKIAGRNLTPTLPRSALRVARAPSLELIKLNSPVELATGR